MGNTQSIGNLYKTNRQIDKIPEEKKQNIGDEDMRKWFKRTTEILEQKKKTKRKIDSFQRFFDTITKIIH